jgi:hypothetical protein
MGMFSHESSLLENNCSLHRLTQEEYTGLLWLEDSVHISRVEQCTASSTGYDDGVV